MLETKDVGADLTAVTRVRFRLGTSTLIRVIVHFGTRSLLRDRSFKDPILWPYSTLATKMLVTKMLDDKKVWQLTILKITSKAKSLGLKVPISGLKFFKILFPKNVRF